MKIAFIITVYKNDKYVNTKTTLNTIENIKLKGIEK